MNDSYEEKSKASSFQALSGDEDIDQLHQKALAAPLGHEGRKDDGESSNHVEFAHQKYRHTVKPEDDNSRNKGTKGYMSKH